jgi:hypothetical protein
MLVEVAVTIDRRYFDAAIFDLDGVMFGDCKTRSLA